MKHSPESDWLVGPPPPTRRRWISVAIALFLASQVAIPLTYYLYKEPTNERFAWRMFSSVHMSDWSRMQIIARARHNGQTLEQIVPVRNLLVESSWQGLYANHPDIRDKFLQYYLEASGADELTYEAQGVWPSGEPMEPVRRFIRRGEGIVRPLAE